MSGSATDTEGVTRPADTMRERAGESRLKLWFLLSANRWLVTGLSSMLAYATLVACFVFGPSSAQRLVTTSGVASLFGSVVIALVTSITLVLSISQFVLTGEIGPLGDQEERMADETTFRTEVEDTAGGRGESGQTLPVPPAAHRGRGRTHENAAGCRQRVERRRPA
jgi:hypothetical protein